MKLKNKKRAVIQKSVDIKSERYGELRQGKSEKKEYDTKGFCDRGDS